MTAPPRDAHRRVRMFAFTSSTRLPIEGRYYRQTARERERRQRSTTLSAGFVAIRIDKMHVDTRTTHNGSQKYAFEHSQKVIMITRYTKYYRKHFEILLVL